MLGSDVCEGRQRLDLPCVRSASLPASDLADACVYCTLAWHMQVQESHKGYHVLILCVMQLSRNFSCDSLQSPRQRPCKRLRPSHPGCLCFQCFLHGCQPLGLHQLLRPDRRALHLRQPISVLLPRQPRLPLPPCPCPLVSFCLTLTSKVQHQVVGTPLALQ